MPRRDSQSKDSNNFGSSPREVLDVEKLKSEQVFDDAIAFAINQLKESKDIYKGLYKRFNRMHTKDNMPIKGEQIVIPASMRFEIVNRIIETERATETVKTTIPCVLCVV